MNPQWQAFLQNQGAVLEDGRVLHFGDPGAERRAARDGDVLVELSELALIRARGADALGFLNGQLSNDLRKLDDAHSQLSSYNSPKGRMLAIPRIFRRGEDYLLQLPAALAEDILKRLRMYVLRSKVTLEIADRELQRIGISGPRAEQLVREAVGSAPTDNEGCLTDSEVTVLRLPGPWPRFEIVAPTAAAVPLWERFAARARKAGAPVWRWLDIQAGVPNVFPGTVEEFVPQMANLELLGGVDFKKGCYPGQEIVARMQYLGRLKQRMYRAHVEADASPQPGDPLHAPDFGEQPAGRVIDAEAAPEGGYDLLAVIQIVSVEGGEVRLGSLQGPLLAFRGLPYPVVLPAA